MSVTRIYLQFHLLLPLHQLRRCKWIGFWLLKHMNLSAKSEAIAHKINRAPSQKAFHPHYTKPSSTMSDPHRRNQGGTGASSDDHLVSLVVNDIVDYDVNSFATTSSRDFDASEYHPYQRQIGGVECNTYQSSSTPVFDDHDSGSANHTSDSAKGSTG